MTSAVMDTAPPKQTELGLKGVLEIASGYQRAQVLFAASALGVFGILADGPSPTNPLLDL